MTGGLFKKWWKEQLSRTCVRSRMLIQNTENERKRILYITEKLGLLLDLSFPQEQTQTMSKSRFGATIEQVGLDLKEGIEGKDIVMNSLRLVRNGAVATWHIINGILPSILNSTNGQKFEVVHRESAFQGTTNAVKKIKDTKGVAGKASAVVLELFDGPVDDGLALIGGAQHIIVPVREGMQQVMDPEKVKQLAA